MHMSTNLRSRLSIELAAAKAADRIWFDAFDDSRLEAGACERSTVERLAASAPSAFLAGWLEAMLPTMLMQQR